MKIAQIVQCAILTALLAYGSLARGYAVGPPLTLEKMAEQADLIFKGTVVSNKPASDSAFGKIVGYETQDTQFKIISVIKGDLPGGQLEFRHYSDNGKAFYASSFEPQSYEFTGGRTYLVFAKKTKNAIVFQQVWMNRTGQRDQGSLLCANDKPPTGSTLKAIVWSELLDALHSQNMSDVQYAMDELDEMSGGLTEFNSVKEFDRREVLSAVLPLMADKNLDIARAAIGMIGSHNPYMSEERAPFWLATVGSVKPPGLGTMDPKFQNIGGKLFWRDLLKVAGGKSDDSVDDDKRALAISALGLVREPKTQPFVVEWLKDSASSVQSSAILLLADFPDLATHDRFAAFANNSAIQVRKSVAHSIGFGQHIESVDVLQKLLGDPDPGVRAAAAMSLLSFSPANESVARIFQANLQNPEFPYLFLNALAVNNPKDYLNALAAAVGHDAGPANPWGGKLPSFESWEILFKYLRSQPVDQITSGKFDRYLDAIEIIKEKYSSSEPRDVYAFYVQRGMTARAAKYRQAAEKSAGYDLDYYFKQVDKNPTLYNRN